MEDDRTEMNNGPEGKKQSKIVMIGGGFIGVCVILAIVGVLSDPKPKQVAAVQTVSVPAPPLESKEDYIASTKKIGTEKDPIFMKEFLKNPLKFKGTRVNVIAKIMVIEEVNNESVIQVFINRDYDTAIIYYPGTLPVYKDDFIKIYGEGGGTYDGENRMGAQMTWPVINAKYVKKIPPRDE